jgi:hypothetical protein
MPPVFVATNFAWPVTDAAAWCYQFVTKRSAGVLRAKTAPAHDRRKRRRR